MTNKFFKYWASIHACLTLGVSADDSASKEISIWAPGMEEPQRFGSRDGEILIELGGSYWAYVIKGISGGIALGNESEKGDFWSVSDTNAAGWGGQESWASVGLEVNGCALTQVGAFFSVSGDEPGMSNEQTTTYFADWLVLRADSDGKLALSIAPLINSGFYEEGEGVANANPTINLTLLADIYRTPPETSGNLSSGKALASRTGKVALSWKYTQGEEVPSSRRLPLTSF